MPNKLEICQFFNPIYLGFFCISKPFWVQLNYGTSFYRLHVLLFHRLLMTKKEYILKVLDALVGYWPLARGLKILIDGNALDDKTIDSLVDILSKTIDEIKDGETKEKLQKSKSVLEQLKKIEWEQHVRDEASLKELDKMIKEI